MNPTQPTHAARHSRNALAALLSLFGLLSPLGLLALPVAALPLAFACGGLATALDSADAAPDDGGYAGFFATDAPTGDEAGPIVIASSPDDAGSARPSAPAPEPTDASGPPVVDGAPDGACTQPLAAGALAIDELMIESVAGAGDYGQWIEVANTRACTVNLVGLHGECAKGAKVNTFDVISDLWIEPGATFLVADSSDPAVDHYLPGALLVWFGQPGGVLRKEGGTVTLMLGATIIDSVTYPSMKPVVGASISFPSDCAPAQRSDWTAWQTSTFSWFPGFLGTPNAPNDDVHCPM